MSFPDYLTRIPNVVDLSQPNTVQIVPKVQVNDQGVHVTIPRSTKQPAVFLWNQKISQLTMHVSEGVAAEVILLRVLSGNAKQSFQIQLDSDASLSLHEAEWNLRASKTSIQRRLTLQKSARLEHQLLSSLEGTSESDFFLDLQGARAVYAGETFLVASGESKAFAHQRLEHHAKSSVSNIQNILVASEASNLDYSVNGFIEKGMAGSICRQQNRGVILSPKGSVRVDPKLYIDEYDVEAGHGAAIGQIDEEQLFYLTSRGLTEDEAKRLILSGYTEQFLAPYEALEIRSRLEQRIANRLKGA
ncbi:MAG: SufD family Fe-S cluster assembly protein [Candidatus Izemoplasmatales bacterium]